MEPEERQEGEKESGKMAEQKEASPGAISTPADRVAGTASPDQKKAVENPRGLPGWEPNPNLAAMMAKAALGTPRDFAG